MRCARMGIRTPTGGFLRSLRFLCLPALPFLSFLTSPPPVMSFNIPITQADPTAPTPQNTPLTHAPIAQGLSRPTVPDITEDNEGDEEETSDTIQQAMLGLVHGRLSGLVGKSSGYIESLPVEVKKNVEALKGVQVKQIELQNQYKRECLELEKKVRTHLPDLRGLHWRRKRSMQLILSAGSGRE